MNLEPAGFDVRGREILSESQGELGARCGDQQNVAGSWRDANREGKIVVVRCLQGERVIRDLQSPKVFSLIQEGEKRTC